MAQRVDEHLVEVGREEFVNAWGRGLCIRWRALRSHPAPPRLQPDAGRALDERLDLVRGVGPKTAERLRREGYRRLAELSRHPRYGREATRLWAALAQRDVSRLLAAGARDVELLGMFGRDEVAVVDIETAGLWQVLPLFLVGCAFRSDSGWEVRQYFARSFDEEAAVLHEVSRELAGRSVCVTYNGKAFDEPFVRARLALHGLPPVRFRLHVDMLHACRRWYGSLLPDCRLATVGAHLFALEREDDIPGAAVPDTYYQYVRDGDDALVAPLLRHNALDLYALACLTELAWAAQPEERDAGTGAALGPGWAG